MKQIRRKITQISLLNFFRMCIEIKFIHDVCNNMFFYHSWYFQQTYIEISALLYERVVHNVMISILDYKYMTHEYFAQIVVNWDE